MKTLVAAVALAAVIASPTYAQTARRDLPPRVQVPQSYTSQYGAGPQQRRNNRNDAYDINGHYVGSDPDAQVRNNLEFDPPSNSGD